MEANQETVRITMDRVFEESGLGRTTTSTHCGKRAANMILRAKTVL
jgi:hypothetical protein